MTFVARIVTTLVIVALTLPAAASAGLRTIVPPGDSAASQYVESVPSAAGKRPTSSLGNQAGALTPSQRQTLDQAGANGKTLVGVVDATSPAGARANGGAGPQGATSSASGAGLPPGAISGKGVRSPVSSVLAAADGSGGMGILLPALMLVAALGILAAVVVRSRRTPPS